MLIDCYGYPSSSHHFLKDEKAACDVVKSGSYTYIRFSTADVGPIHRIDESVSGTTAVRWAYGSWSDKTILEYVTDKNTPLEV